MNYLPKAVEKETQVLVTWSCKAANLFLLLSSKMTICIGFCKCCFSLLRASYTVDCGNHRSGHC